MPANNHITVASWPAVADHYRSLIAHGWQLEPLLQLVTHISGTQYANRLYAFTSLDKLVVGIYNPLERDREVLHISFDGKVQLWFFEYRPGPNLPAEFLRQYSAEKGVEKFEHLIQLLKW